MNSKEQQKKIEEQKKLISNLTGALPDALKQFTEVKKASEGILNTLITPQIERGLSLEQRKLLDSARAGFDLDGKDVADRLKEITETLQNYATSNK